MNNDTTKQTDATPFPQRLSVSLNYSELEPCLSLFVQATISKNPELLEIASNALIDTIEKRGALFRAVEVALNPEFGSSDE